MERPEHQGLSYSHIVVVHGIGNQAPNETALAFMNQLMRALDREGWGILANNLIENEDLPKPVATGESPERHAFRPAYLLLRRGDRVEVVGFSEVYWRPIPDVYIKANDGHLPLPAFAWARSVAARTGLRGKAYHRARETIDNLDELLVLLRTVVGMRGRGKQFDEIVRQFLGDVEVYTESDTIRRDIDGKFRSVLSRIGIFQEQTAREFNTPFADPKIYVVAHSEGTVIAYNGLIQGALDAAMGRGNIDNELTEQWATRYREVSPAVIERTVPAVWWMKRIRGFVTLGSPLDKHFTLWNDRFRTDRLGSHSAPLTTRIPWWNVWDQSDPVGHGLAALFPPPTRRGTADTRPGGLSDARKVFDPQYDKGFWRYWIPLKAHVDYWTDEGLFRMIVRRVLDLAADGSGGAELGNRPGVATLLRPLDRAVYFGLRFAAVMVGVFFLSRLVDPVTGPLTASASGMLAAMQAHWYDWAGFTLGPVAVAMLFWALYVEADTHAIAKPIRVLWMLSVVAVVPLLVLAAAAHPWAWQVSYTIPDALGYLTGLAGAVVGWRVHSLVHRGLVQMWRYGRRADARVPVPDRIAPDR